MRAKYLDRDGQAGEAPICSSRGWRLSPRVWRLRVVLRAEGLPRGLDLAGVEAPGGESRPAGCFGDKPAGKWNQSKTVLQNNDLHGNRDHGCVLFVQHLSRNGLTYPVWSGSFVACAEVFGNCHLATEGGIPRSSR